MPAPTIKQVSALITTEGVTIKGADIKQAHTAVMDWANDPRKRRAVYSDQRVGHVAALIAMARQGTGELIIDVLDVVTPTTIEDWNDGAALARYLRNDGLAGCAGIAPLRIRQSRIDKGTEFAVTID